MVNWRYEWGYEEDAPNRIPISEYTVNKEFLDLNNIQVCEGRMFEEEDYQISGNQVPVLVGKDLQEEYQALDVSWHIHIYWPFSLPAKWQQMSLQGDTPPDPR